MDLNNNYEEYCKMLNVNVICSYIVDTVEIVDVPRT